MRHRKRGLVRYKLSRTAEHRRALLRGLAVALIKHKHIKTTLTKAKALRSYIEPLITRARKDTTHNRRLIFATLKDKHAVKELFSEIAPRVMNRPGGYTRIVKLGHRRGDNARVALVELVDFNENFLSARGQKQDTGSARSG